MGTSDSWMQSSLALRIFGSFYKKEVSKVLTRRNPEKPTLVYHHTNSFLPLDRSVIDLSKYYNIHLVTQVHDLMHVSHPELFQLQEIRKRQLLDDVFFKNSRTIIVSSLFTKQEFIRLYPEIERKIKLQPFSIEHIEGRVKRSTAKRIQRRDEVFRRSVVFVSKAWPNKQHLSLIKEFGQLNDPKFTLTLVGDLSLIANELQKTLSNNRNAKMIEICNYVNDEDLQEIMDEAYAFLHASKYEGFGFPYLEKLLTGKPVFTVSNGMTNILKQYFTNLHVSRGNSTRILLRDIEKSIDDIKFNFSPISTTTIKKSLDKYRSSEPQVNLMEVYLQSIITEND